MSQEKAQLIAPLGVMAVEGMNASGVITATSLDGNIVGSAKSLVNGANVSVGVITATSFTGNLTGNIARLADSAPDVDAGVTTATSFVGNLTGSVTDLTSQPAITVGMVTATTLEGPVTGNITGNVTGIADGLSDGLGVNYNGGWTGAGTSQITAGVITATTFYGDGSNLDGVSSGPVSQQAVTIDGASTTIDLSNGNLIYASQSADTTVSFANSENGNVYFVRVKDATTTARTITWPDRISWNGGSAPTLISSNSTNEAQVFLLVTRDMGVTWYGDEIYNNPGGTQLWGWGYNIHGALGLNDGVQRSSPCQIGTNVGWNFRGNERLQTNICKNDGTLWVWGWGGDSGADGRNVPQTAKLSSPTQLGTDTTWVGTAGDQGGAFAVKTNGTLWSWGYNLEGYLGLNDRTSRSSPTQVGTDTTWASGVNKYDKSGSWSAAIKTNGTLWTWGVNNNGSLGLNQEANNVKLSSPTQVGTDTTWNRVYTSYTHSVATKTDGTLWAWGENNWGQLGQNSKGDANRKSSPTQIGTDTTWSLDNVYNGTQGSNLTCAAKTDGTLWSWGLNTDGQLGHNNTISASSPIQIPGSWNFACLTTSSGATRTDGTLYTWGYNHYGCLGHNNIHSTTGGRYSSPTQIPGTGWDKVSTNTTRMFASKS